MTFKDQLAAWLAPVAAQLAPLREHYAALQPRERKIVLAGTACAALAVIYLAVWEPAVHARANNLQALQQARDTALQIEVLAARAPVPNATSAHHGDADGRSLLTVVDLASRGAKNLSAPVRLQPDGDRKVRIWFEHASFPALVQWIDALQVQHGITVGDADIARGKAQGTVDARFSLQGQP